MTFRVFEINTASKNPIKNPVKLDEAVKSRKSPDIVIPAQVGIHKFQIVIDSRLRGSDTVCDFLRNRQTYIYSRLFTLSAIASIRKPMVRPNERLSMNFIWLSWSEPESTEAKLLRHQ